MTIQEAFERSDFVEFIPSDNVIILHFQHEPIMEEFYTALKEEATKNEFHLEIKILTDSEPRIQLIIHDINKQPIYASGQLMFRQEQFEKFVANREYNYPIKFYCDIIVIQNGQASTASRKWLAQQNEPDKVVFSGYFLS